MQQPILESNHIHPQDHPQDVDPVMQIVIAHVPSVSGKIKCKKETKSLSVEVLKSIENEFENPLRMTSAEHWTTGNKKKICKKQTPTTQSAGGFDDAADKNIGGILVMQRI